MKTIRIKQSIQVACSAEFTVTSEASAVSLVLVVCRAETQSAFDSDA